MTDKRKLEYARATYVTGITFNLAHIKTQTYLYTMTDNDYVDFVSERLRYIAVFDKTTKEMRGSPHYSVVIYDKSIDNWGQIVTTPWDLQAALNIIYHD